ncbi:MerR family transcriptional regulator [Amedibacillus sp. YH-ame6]
MKKYYTTGQFAKLANVSERTIRYYDKEGLLKPSFIMENGYRKYSEEDLIKLQRILSLKQLGFSLDEIRVMNQTDNKQAFLNSLSLQIDLLDKKIKHTQSLKDSLIQTKNLLENNKKNVDWNKVVEVIHINSQDEKIIEHYRNANNLSVRIQLHEKYSLNKIGWFPWLFSKIDFLGVNRLLELGCGTGELWKEHTVNSRNREIFLSDISEGMVETTRKNLGEDFNYMVIDAQKIPFKNGYFDAVVANHMMFYLTDISKGIEEISRVLKKGGKFYCSTYGKNHMKEIGELVKEFDERIALSDTSLYERFGLDNGINYLGEYFRSIKKVTYDDNLIVTDAQALFDYIISCHGNQLELLSNRLDEFKKFIENKLNREKGFYITKDAGLYICEK